MVGPRVDPMQRAAAAVIVVDINVLEVEEVIVRVRVDTRVRAVD